MKTSENKTPKNYTLSVNADRCYHSFLKLMVPAGIKVCVSCGETIS
jgi:hypothetical protein